jgi:hypothetical protein
MEGLICYCCFLWLIFGWRQFHVFAWLLSLAGLSLAAISRISMVALFG